MTMYDPALVKELVRRAALHEDLRALAEALRDTAVPWDNAARGYKRAYHRMRQKRYRKFAGARVRTQLTQAQIIAICTGRYACETAVTVAKSLDVPASRIRKIRREYVRRSASNST